MMDEGAPDRWLSLSEASALMGVHVSTLRRWADTGRVPCRRTPGGHRRFSLRSLQPLLHLGEDTVEIGVQGQPDEQDWHVQFEAAGLVPKLRTIGQRMSGVLMQYLIRTGDDERLLAEASELGVEYARQCVPAGVELLAAVSAYLYYRTSLTDVLGQLPHADSGGPTPRPAHRYDSFMDAVLLGLVSGYEERRNGAY